MEIIRKRKKVISSSFRHGNSTKAGVEKVSRSNDKSSSSLGTTTTSFTSSSNKTSEEATVVPSTQTFKRSCPHRLTLLLKVLFIMACMLVLLMFFMMKFEMELNSNMTVTSTLSSPSAAAAAATTKKDDGGVGKSANVLKIGVFPFLDSTSLSQSSASAAKVYYPIYDIQEHILQSFDEELFKSSIQTIYNKKKIKFLKKNNKQMNRYLDGDIEEKKKTKVMTMILKKKKNQNNSDNNNEEKDSLNESKNRSVMVMTRKSYKGGKIADQVNQDRAIVILNPLSAAKQITTSNDGSQNDNNDIDHHNHSDSSMMIGIFDGHSQQGHIVAHYVQQELPKVLSKKLSSMLQHPFTKANNTNNEFLLKQTIIDAFNTTDSNIPVDYGMNAGCTTSIIIQIDKTTICTANVGDSQSFIIRYNKATKEVDIVYMTKKHKPDDVVERNRIEGMGGVVYIPRKKEERHNGVIMEVSSRVTIPNTPMGPVSLAMSRSMGDHDGKDVGLISVPTVDILQVTELKMKTTSKRNNDDTKSQYNESYDPDDVVLYAIAASDGLLDFITPLEIAERLAKSFADESGATAGRYGSNRELMNACEDLLLQASRSWSKLGMKYRDDITIAVSQIF